MAWRVSSRLPVLETVGCLDCPGTRSNGGEENNHPGVESIPLLGRLHVSAHQYGVGRDASNDPSVPNSLVWHSVRSQGFEKFDYLLVVRFENCAISVKMLQLRIFLDLVRECVVRWCIRFWSFTH